MKRATCPVCGKKNSKVIFFRDFEGAKEIVPFIRYDIIICSQCGMVYAGNIEESMPLDKYYESISKYESKNYSLSKAAQEEYADAIDFLLPVLNQQDDILDIGCGQGNMLALFQKKGFKNLAGIDPSEKNVNLINNVHGIRAYLGSLGGNMSALVNKKFDLIILEGVLEHLISLKSNIVECIKYLKDDGLLYIGVPDLEQFTVSCDLYQQFSIEHINYFSKESLRNLMQRANLKCFSFFQNGKGELFSLWKREKTDENRIQFATDSMAGLTEYLSQCKALEERIRNTFLTKTLHKDYYIWGASSHTAMLYQLKIINPDKVKGIIDSNTNYQGRTIYRHKIQDPQTFYEETTPILISSQYAQEAIKRYIKNDLKLENEVITLY